MMDKNFIETCLNEVSQGEVCKKRIITILNNYNVKYEETIDGLEFELLKKKYVLFNNTLNANGTKNILHFAEFLDIEDLIEMGKDRDPKLLELCEFIEKTTEEFNIDDVTIDLINNEYLSSITVEKNGVAHTIGYSGYKTNTFYTKELENANLLELLETLYNKE